MKRFAAFILSFLLLMPLLATVSISNSVPKDYAIIMEKALKESLDGRGQDAAITHFVEEEEGGLVAFTLVVDGTEFSSRVAPEFLFDEISNMLFYEESLYEDGEILDYVYNNSYSFLPSAKYHKGDVLKAYDKNNKLRGKFYVDKVYEEAVVLRPTYLEKALPGMRLEKSSPLRVSLMASADFKLQRKNLEAFFQYPTVTYPVHPMASLVVESKEGEEWLGLGLGVGSDFSFASLWPNSVPVLRNATLRGDAEFLFGFDGTYQGRFHATLDTTIGSHLTLGVGLVAYALSVYGVGVVGGFSL